MASFIDNLLAGLQTMSTPGGGIGGGLLEDDIQDIPVTGTRLPTRTVPTETRSVPPVSRRQEEQEPTPELLKRKGMFGVKGTMRDILGVLGDAFLAQGGGKAVYAPQRDKERQGSAQYGFTDNPMAAIERLGEIDPEGARALYEQVAKQQQAQAAQQSLQANRSDMINDRAFTNTSQASNAIARLFAGAKTPADQEIARKLARAIAARAGTTVEALGLSNELGADEMGLFSNIDMTVNQQMDLPNKGRSLDIAQQNADSNRIRANRPPAGRAAPQPTRASLAAPLLEKLGRGETLTQGQQDYLDRVAPPPAAKRGRAAPSGVAPRPGLVKNGYRFKGGDPAVQSNWTKVN